MAKYSKFNLVYILQKWMDSVAGQTFMNYAYSWGASIVILGTLFKLTHLPGANAMLFIGMGTEVFVFFIAAFDRPFDKTAEGRNLASDSELASQLANSEDETDVNNGLYKSVIIGDTNDVHGNSGINAGVGNAGSGNAGGTIIIGGGNVGGNTGSGQVAAVAGGTGEDVVPAGGQQPVVIGAPAPAVTPETAEQMEDVTKTYIERLEQLNETLLKVAALSEKLSIDSEEMENLNRTLTGIARVYEMQLKSASQQITTQDDINAQTKKMAESIAELNSCYARMIEAMTVNVPGAAKM